MDVKVPSHIWTTLADTTGKIQKYHEYGRRDKYWSKCTSSERQMILSRTETSRGPQPQQLWEAFLGMVDTVHGLDCPLSFWLVTSALVMEHLLRCDTDFEEKAMVIQRLVSGHTVMALLHSGMSKIQDGRKNELKEAEQVIPSFDKRWLLILYGIVIKDNRAIIPEVLCKNYIERNPGRSSA